MSLPSLVSALPVEINDHDFHELAQRFPMNGPRYTSYPTADRFVEGFGPREAAVALAARRLGIVNERRPIAIYVHLPFCDSLCYYCACNKIITKKYDRAEQYLEYLEREIALITDFLGVGQTVEQLHLGGGTPTFFADQELDKLMSILKRHFKLSELGEIAIEIDPRTVDIARLKRIRSMGFNRLSLGVQDLDPRVQRAVNRVHATEQVGELIESAKSLGFVSVNVDLIYGLPQQTVESHLATVRSTIALGPDRIALYAYAHLPARFKAQRRIHSIDLPPPAAKLSMLEGALQAFRGAGYVYVGMDHFAKPQDSLAIAKRQGRLHRNFQGYTTYPDSDLIAFGVSAISRVGASYYQNAKTLDEYYNRIDHRVLPVERGIALTRDDLIRRSVIMSLMCQGSVDRQAVSEAYFIEFNDYFAIELEELAGLEVAGLVALDSESVQVTSVGWYFVRLIAMVFDRYLRANADRERFSRII